MALCNNVFYKEEQGKSIFNASSPDEIAMVEFFEEVGFEFKIRDDQCISFKNPIGDL